MLGGDGRGLPGGRGISHAGDQRPVTPQHRCSATTAAVSNNTTQQHRDPPTNQQHRWVLARLSAHPGDQLLAPLLSFPGHFRQSLSTCCPRSHQHRHSPEGLRQFVTLNCILLAVFCPSFKALECFTQAFLLLKSFGLPQVSYTGSYCRWCRGTRLASDDQRCSGFAPPTKSRQGSESLHMGGAQVKRVHSHVSKGKKVDCLVRYPTVVQKVRNDHRDRRGAAVKVEPRMEG